MVGYTIYINYAGNTTDMEINADIPCWELLDQFFGREDLNLPIRKYMMEYQGRVAGAYSKLSEVGIGSETSIEIVPVKYLILVFRTVVDETYLSGFGGTITNYQVHLFHGTHTDTDEVISGHYREYMGYIDFADVDVRYNHLWFRADEINDIQLQYIASGPHDDMEAATYEPSMRHIIQHRYKGDIEKLLSTPNEDIAKQDFIKAIF